MSRGYEERGGFMVERLEKRGRNEKTSNQPGRAKKTKWQEISYMYNIQVRPMPALYEIFSF